MNRALILALLILVSCKEQIKEVPISSKTSSVQTEYQADMDTEINNDEIVSLTVDERLVEDASAYGLDLQVEDDARAQLMSLLDAVDFYVENQGEIELNKELHRFVIKYFNHYIQKVDEVAGYDYESIKKWAEQLVRGVYQRGNILFIEQYNLQSSLIQRFGLNSFFTEGFLAAVNRSEFSDDLSSDLFYELFGSLESNQLKNIKIDKNFVTDLLLEAKNVVSVESRQNLNSNIRFIENSFILADLLTQADGAQMTMEEFREIDSIQMEVLDCLREKVLENGVSLQNFSNSNIDHPLVDIYVKRGLLEGKSFYANQVAQISNYEVFLEKMQTKSKLLESQSSIAQYAKLRESVIIDRYFLENQASKRGASLDSPYSKADQLKTVYKTMLNNTVKALNLYHQEDNRISLENIYSSNIDTAIATNLSSMSTSNTEGVAVLNYKDNEKYFAPDIYTTSEDLQIRVKNLRFHPLAVVLARGSDIKIEAETVKDLWIDSSASLLAVEKLKHTNSEYVNAAFPFVKRSGQYYNLKNGSTILAKGGKQPKGKNGKDAGDIFISTSNIKGNLLLIATGEDGQDGADGQSRSYSDGEFVKTFSVGRVIPATTGRRFRGHGEFQQVIEYPIAAQDLRGPRSVQLYNITAGDGGDGGSGGKIELGGTYVLGNEVKSKKVTSVTMSGKAGKQGEKNKSGLRHPRVKVSQDGKQGRDGKVVGL